MAASHDSIRPQRGSQVHQRRSSSRPARHHGSGRPSCKAGQEGLWCLDRAFGRVPGRANSFSLSLSAPCPRDTCRSGQDGDVSSPPLYDPSPPALAPLMATFWSSKGWRDRPAWPEPEVMARAVRAGVMFDAPLQNDHDGWVAAARDAVRMVSAQEAGQAFLASMTSGRLGLRSALGSYAVTRHLPGHDLVPGPYATQCGLCGLYPDEEPVNANTLNFERFKWGGVRREAIYYLAFDLQQFARAPKLVPTAADIAVAQQVIDTLRSLPVDATAAQAAPRLRTIKGNKQHREIVLDILGVAGVLRTAAHPGYTDTYIPLASRPLPSQRYVFGHYPTCWWRAGDGINTAALHEFLPQVS